MSRYTPAVAASYFKESFVFLYDILAKEGHGQVFDTYTYAKLEEYSQSEMNMSVWLVCATKPISIIKTCISFKSLFSIKLEIYVWYVN